MWNIKEEDLDGFWVICSSCLSFEGILGFMIGIIVYVLVMMFFFIGILVIFGWDYYIILFEKIIFKIEFVLYSL